MPNDRKTYIIVVTVTYYNKYINKIEIQCISRARQNAGSSLIGYTFNEIIAFLLCKHGIAVSLPQLKRILRRTGLLKNNNAKPVIEIVQRTVSLHRQRFFVLGYRAMWTLLNGVCKIRATQ